MCSTDILVGNALVHTDFTHRYRTNPELFVTLIMSEVGLMQMLAVTDRPVTTSIEPTRLARPVVLI